MFNHIRWVRWTVRVGVIAQGDCIEVDEDVRKIRRVPQDARTGSGRFPRISSGAIFMSSLREERCRVSVLSN
jgi:hypothetical protein